MKLDDAEAKQRIEDFLGKEKADELFEKMLDTSDIKKRLADFDCKYEISYEDFVEKFKPIQNHFAGSSGSFENCAFETFGEELEYVQKVYLDSPNRIWTVVDEDGRLFINSGFGVVNRMCYLITEDAFDEGDNFTICIDEEDDE